MISLDKRKLDIFMGLRVAVFTIIPMVVALITSNVSSGLIFALGTYLLSTDETKSPDSWRTVRILLAAVFINAIALALGTLVGLAGWYGVPLFGLGFFLASFIAIYADTTVLGLVACVLFSVGIGLPGGGTVVAAGDRFLLCLLAGIWALLGVVCEMAVRSRRSLKVVRVARTSHSSTLREKIRPLVENLSLKSHHFRFSFAFGLAGAFGLIIALSLDLSRDYWVLLTLAILLQRSESVTTVSYSLERIVGTALGAVIGWCVLVTFVDPWFLLLFLFISVALYFATRNINFGLGTIFMTLLVLILVSIPDPGHPLLAETRILDTTIASMIALLTVFLLWASTQRKRFRNKSSVNVKR
jgi:hypothetical protein